MKFYIASTLENEKDVKSLAKKLKKAGYEQTYDWTTHGSVQVKSQSEITIVARKEYSGAHNADFLVVLLPGARGTHVELGIALASHNVKDIYIWGENDEAFIQDERTCSFYHLPKVTQIICPFKKLAKELFREMSTK